MWFSLWRTPDVAIIRIDSWTSTILRYTFVSGSLDARTYINQHDLNCERFQTALAGLTVNGSRDLSIGSAVEDIVRSGGLI